MKIDACPNPYCLPGECVYREQSGHHWIACLICGYCSPTAHDEKTAIGIHNGLSCNNRWGKATKQLKELLNLEHAVDSMDPPAWVELIASEIKNDRYLAKAAKKFAENPPPDKIVAKSHDLNSEGAFARGWLDCRNFMCNRLKAAMEENDVLVCDQCGRKATAVFDVGDICPCGGSFVEEQK